MSRAAAHTRRHRARRGQGDRLRAQILDAAEELIARTGDAAAVSIRAVAQAVGVTAPSIYMHFADKDTLIWEVCERAFVDFNSWIDDAVGDAADPLEVLRLRGRAYVRFGLENPEQYRIMFMNRPAKMPSDYDWATAPGFACFRNVVENVDQCIRAGLLASADPFEVSLVLWTAVHGLTSALLAAPDGFPWPPDRDALVERMLDTQLRGLGAG